MGRQYTLRPMATIRSTPCRIAATLGIIVVLTTLALSSSRVTAHEIPNDVTVHAFLRPQGQRLRLLVRAPLAAMRDIQFPTRERDYLDLERAEAAVRDAATLWISDSVSIFEDGARLPAPDIVSTRISLPSDRSFTSYDSALAHITAPALAPETTLVWSQAMMDVLFEYPIASERSRFDINPQLGRLGLRVVTALRFVSPDGVERAFELRGDPGLVRLDPRWHQSALRFVQLGFLHILDGADHLLFLLCLVLPFRKLRPLVIVVTAFTAAHSLTLVASAFSLVPDALWFPPLVETLIAASIVYMALENIVASAKLRDHRWAIAFAFGLVHGFGFSFALRETLQFAGSHVVTSLVAFNVGVELGQLLVLAILVPAIRLLFRYVVDERMGTIILSALVAHTAWHWMIERGAVLSRFDWPSLTAGGVAAVLKAAMWLLILAGAMWLLSLARRVYGPAPRTR